MLSGENLLKNRKNPETVIHSGQGGIYRRGHPPSYFYLIFISTIIFEVITDIFTDTHTPIPLIDSAE